jgi:transcriptional regulator with XRE-family HTH domain
MAGKPVTSRRRLFIREWRAYRDDMSQEELADRVGMTAGNLSNLENAKINYTQDTLERVAEALNCHVVDLLTRAPQDSPNLFALWDRASQAKRATMLAVAEAILREPEDPTSKRN